MNGERGEVSGNSIARKESGRMKMTDLAVQVRGGSESDEELGTVGVGTLVCHDEEPGDI
jgi:hypothetical protein